MSADQWFWVNVTYQSGRVEPMRFSTRELLKHLTEPQLDELEAGGAPSTPAGISYELAATANEPASRSTTTAAAPTKRQPLRLNPGSDVLIELPVFYDCWLLAHGIEPIGRLHEPFGSQPYRVTFAEWSAIAIAAATDNLDDLAELVEDGLETAADPQPIPGV
ncbi:MAG: hypothetical protein JWM89_1520 [Acidimicrobiales bacterium]|nr:hypothetical protein [Acidimicrobiales bacterium]